MARTPSETMTGREAQVMDAVWRLGEATAEQVREALPAAVARFDGPDAACGCSSRRVTWATSLAARRMCIAR